MTRRYEFAPLAEAMGMTPGALAKELGISGSTWKGYRDHGMSEVVADRRAAQCGLVAYEVWPEMRDHSIEDEAARKRKLRTEAQRRWRSKPEVRQRERERRARYYREVAEYERRRERERYWSDPEKARRRQREKRARRAAETTFHDVPRENMAS